MIVLKKSTQYVAIVAMRCWTLTINVKQCPCWYYSYICLIKRYVVYLNFIIYLINLSKIEKLMYNSTSYAMELKIIPYKQERKNVLTITQFFRANSFQYFVNYCNNWYITIETLNRNFFKKRHLKIRNKHGSASRCYKDVFGVGHNKEWHYILLPY